MSNAPQSGAFVGVDVLARKPDANVLVVDAILLPQCVEMFPQMAVIGVKGQPKPYDGLRDRTVLVWTVYPEKVYAGIPSGNVGTINGDKGPATFLSNPAAGFAYARANIKRYVRQAEEPEAPPAPVQTVPRPSLGIVEPSGAVRKPAETPERDWRAGLIVTRDGTPKVLLANAICALRDSPAWVGALGFDSFAGRTCAVGALPFPAKTGQWTDTMDALTAEWLQHEGIHVNAAVAAQAVETVAKEHPFHPVVNYLDALKWDDVERVDTWLSAYLGATDSPYTRAAGKAWLVSAVARVRKPGCKADMALILEGEQGAMKSTAFDVLGGQWFTDDIEKLGTKDAAMQAMAAWIIEMAELDAMTRKVEISGVKAFLSRRSDRFRLPYGKRIIEAPRQCVFCGTVNPGGSGYLHDDTGNRRFLPVKVGRIDIDALRADRDQLWAEASAMFAAGEPWWFTDAGTVALAKTEQDARREHDVWEPAIEQWLETSGNPDFVTMAAVMADGLNVEVEKQGKTEQRRVGACLRALGWEPGAKRYGSKSIRGWKRLASVTLFGIDA